MDVDQSAFIPGRDKLAKGESLAPDPSAYELLHSLSASWPCLSFDLVHDVLGDNRKMYPATLYAVTGTQAEDRRANSNELMVMKLSGLSRMDRERDLDDSDASSNDDEETSDPVLETKSLPLKSTTNRIRCHQPTTSSSSSILTTLTATMLESSDLVIHDITSHLKAFDYPGTTISPQQNNPLTTLKMHKSEGYALAWSPLDSSPKLLSGDNSGVIYATTLTDSSTWTTDPKPYTGHQGSVEDIQWSPSERNVFSSCSSDGTVKIWDTRSKSHSPAVNVQVSTTDVNVISWSRQTPHLLASGADDGQWAVWDLRQWKPSAGSKPLAASNAPTPVAKFDFHKEQITSIEWNPHDSSVVSVAAGDHTISLWDLAVELDDEEGRAASGLGDVPPQLLFVHYMEMVKECHWHQQIPGTVVATGSGGFQ